LTYKIAHIFIIAYFKGFAKRQNAEVWGVSGLFLVSMDEISVKRFPNGAGRYIIV